MNKILYKFKKKAIWLMLNINKVKHKYILFHDDNYLTEEETSALKYIKINGIDTFTNKLSKKYDPNDIVVFRDVETGMKYVYWNERKLYLPNSYCDEQIKDYITFLYSEQDELSPHSYSNVNVPEDSVIIDIGAAEGNFTLDGVESSSKAYLFECDNKWIETLKKTFEPYNEKVIINNVFVEKENPLDKFINNDDLKKNLIIKIDAEGTEMDIINSSEIIKNGNPTIVVTTYHRGEDAENIKNKLLNYGYEVQFTKGLLLFLYSIKTSKPLFRKGLILAKKRK